MKRIRSIKKAAEEIKAKDPGTSITYNTIRMWVLSGEVPCVRNGRAIYIDMDKLEAYMACDN